MRHRRESVHQSERAGLSGASKNQGKFAVFGIGTARIALIVAWLSLEATVTQAGWRGLRCSRLAEKPELSVTPGEIIRRRVLGSASWAKRVPIKEVR